MVAACTGPSGTQGHCNDMCCPAATDACVTDYDAGGQYCCAFHSMLRAAGFTTRKLQEYSSTAHDPYYTELSCWVFSSFDNHTL